VDLSDEFDRPSGALAKIQGILHSYPYLSPLSVLILAMIVFTFLNERFILATNLSLMTQQAVIVGTLAIAQTLIILTAGIDLSIGALMVFGQMMMANMAAEGASNVANYGLPSAIAILIGIAIATLAGAFNGFLIVRLKLPPFIVTLGTLSVFTALTLIFFKARTIQGGELPDFMRFMGTTPFSIGSFQVMTGVLAMLALYAIFSYILRNTSWGTHIYAVGDDPDAAELSGINTDRVLFSVYTVSGLIMGIAAWITIGRVGSASPNVAPDINLDTITAVVIGGTSLFGGRGSAYSALLGILVIWSISNGLALLSVSANVRYIVTGAVLLLAVVIDSLSRRSRAAHGRA